MATEGGHIDFMLLAPSYPAAESATERPIVIVLDVERLFWSA